jgi:hypothetical protein
MRPGGQDLWNGELYARSDDKWGSLGRNGTLRLNETLVLRHLTGGELSDDPSLQAQALATVLHESRHARAAVDAPAESNALRQPQSIGLDEGLIELSSIEDFAAFAQQAGYEGVPQPKPEYKGAVDASAALLERAASSDAERSDLLSTAVDQPVVMRWDVVADSIVRNGTSSPTSCRRTRTINRPPALISSPRWPCRGGTVYSRGGYAGFAAAGHLAIRPQRVR